MGESLAYLVRHFCRLPIQDLILCVIQRFVTFVDARNCYWEEVIDGIDKSLMEIVEVFRTGPEGVQLVPGKFYFLLFEVLHGVQGFGIDSFNVSLTLSNEPLLGRAFTPNR